jgi:hypothetical protein
MALDLTLIETMPLGEVEEDRTDHYLPLDTVKRRLEEQFTLLPSTRRTGGPARYFEIAELGTRLGLITPLTNNFCDGCNRIRIAATGTVYGCLGHDQKVELRDALRSGGPEAVDALLDRLLAGKPRRHDFHIGGEPAVTRHMSVTGADQQRNDSDQSLPRRLLREALRHESRIAGERRWLERASSRRAAPIKHFGRARLPSRSALPCGRSSRSSASG